MTQREIEELLPAFADGELTGATRDAVATAVELSPPLQTQVARWRALRVVARRTLHATPLPSTLRTRIAQMVPAAREPATALRRAPWWRRGRTLIGAAAMLLVAIGLAFYGARRPPPAPPPSGVARVAVAEFLARHAEGAAAPDALGVRGQPPAEARARVSQQCGYPVLMPDLTAQGWLLAGARECRLDSTAGALTCVQVVYRDWQDAARTVSMFSTLGPLSLPERETWTDPGPAGRTYQSAFANDYGVLTWSECHTSHAICATLPHEVVLKLANSVTLDGSPAPPAPEPQPAPPRPDVPGQPSATRARP
jgi:anti-sigma factor RsiW